ncbi:hypothetical protein [Granulibacter bethesdensis]|uniref:hypothetical protein n=1 Tax=Granulibacter bethesdensis TaxID=364410 RepID=UPI0003F21440|nr:hypothetical protein [Granulibacter bethesdensis]AHJ65991.1 Hypothetical protein GbCGDNIH4_1547 [Granulibacter bethesdensis CGDNIH4]
MNWSPLIDAVAQGGAYIATTVLVPGVLAWAARRWNINAEWSGTIQQAAGAAYAAAVASGKPVTDPSARAAALSAGVEYLRQRARPTMLHAQGITTDAAAMAAVEAGLGTLLARDPTVGAANGGAAQLH